MKRYFLRVVLAIFSVACVFNFSSCSKYKGYKEDKETGIYYNFHVLNKDSMQPKTGDAVLVTYEMALKDSILDPMMPLQILVQESKYKGDVFDAIRMLHLGDSATFILDADTFFHYYMRDAKRSFEDKELYFTFKLHEIMPKEEVEAYMKAQEEEYKMYMEQMAQAQLAEDSLINDYVKKNRINVTPTASGLYFIPKKSGNGAQAIVGQKVKVHYTGRLLDGTVFDSSIERGEPIDFVLGQGQVISGWDEGIAMMREGDKAVLLIPSKLAYGAREIPGIPPFSPLVFDVELVKVGN